MQNLKEVRVRFEGPQGAGKSTLLASIKQALRDAGVDVEQAREDEHSIVVHTNHSQLKSLALSLRAYRRSA